jgi:hypothetical protein
MEFPAHVYKDNGPFHRKGGTYSVATVESEDDLNAKLEEGWVLHPDDIDAPVVNIKAPESNDAPTRDELELKAKELKIKFTDKTSNEELGKLIAAKLG